MSDKTLNLTSICLGLFLLINFGCKKTDIISAAGNNSENYKAVGASANDFLSAAKYSSVKIEIQYMPGFAPDAASVNNVVAFLNSLLNKPGGITVVQTPIASAGKPIMTLNDIADVEKNNRTVFTSGNQLGVYFLYTDSKYSEQTALGVAFRNTSMAIMGRTLHDNSGAIGQVTRTKLESTILEHESGHLLGLVNLGTPMVTDHKDPSYVNHCNNSNCLMYYGINTAGGVGVLLGGTIPSLDANCRADLTANGGK